MKDTIPKEHYRSAGIYEIRNLINNKIYIGSTNRLRRRFRDHRGMLMRGAHPNKILNSSVKKHGIENFIFNVLLTLTCNASPVELSKELARLEGEYIKIKKADILEYGYNLASVAIINSGWVHKPDSKSRIKGGNYFRDDKYREGIRIQLQGEKSHRAKLTDQQVGEIKCMLDGGVRVGKVARHFGVASTTISYIKSGETWGHVLPLEGNINIERVVGGARTYRGLLSASVVKKIKFLLSESVSRSIIYKTLMVNHQTVRGIALNQNYPEIKSSEQEIIEFKSEFCDLLIKYANQPSVKKYTKQQIDLVMQLYAMGVPRSEIVARSGVGLAMVKMIRSGRVK